MSNWLIVQARQARSQLSNDASIMGGMLLIKTRLRPGFFIGSVTLLSIGWAKLAANE